MADDPKTLEIVIKMLAQLQGAKDAEAQLKSLTKEADNQVKASSELSAAGQKYADKLKATEPDVEKFKLSHREIHEIFGGLTRSAPELGHAVASLADPYVAVAIAIAYTVGQMAEMKTATDAIEASPLPEMEWGDVERKQAIADAIHEVVEAYNAYNRERAYAAADGGIQKRSDENAKADIDAENARVKGETDVLKAQLKVRETAIDELEKAGVFSHAQAQALKFEADKNYQAQLLDLEEKKRQFEIARLKGEQGFAEERRKMGEAALPAAVKAAEKTKTKRTNNEKRLDALTAQLEKLKEELPKAGKDVGDAQGDLNRWTDPTNNLAGLLPGFGLIKQKLIETARAEREAATSRQAAIISEIHVIQAEVDKRTAQKDPLEEADTKAKEEVAHIEKQIDKATDKAEDLGVEIAGKTAQGDIEKKSAQDVAKATTLTSALQTVMGMIRNPSVMLDASNAQDALDHGKKITGAQQGEIDALTTVLEGVGKNQGDIIAMLRDSLQSRAAQNAELLSLRQAYNQLSGQSHASGSNNAPP